MTVKGVLFDKLKTKRLESTGFAPADCPYCDKVNEISDFVGEKELRTCKHCGKQFGIQKTCN